MYNVSPFLQELTLLQHDNVVALLDCKVSQFFENLKKLKQQTLNLKRCNECQCNNSFADR